MSPKNQLQLRQGGVVFGQPKCDSILCKVHGLGKFKGLFSSEDIYVSGDKDTSACEITKLHEDNDRLREELDNWKEEVRSTLTILKNVIDQRWGSQKRYHVTNIRSENILYLENLEAARMFKSQLGDFLHYRRRDWKRFDR